MARSRIRHSQLALMSAHPFPRHAIRHGAVERERPAPRPRAGAGRPGPASASGSGSRPRCVPRRRRSAPPGSTGTRCRRSPPPAAPCRAAPRPRCRSVPARRESSPSRVRPAGRRAGLGSCVTNSTELQGADRTRWAELFVSAVRPAISVRAAPVRTIRERVQHLRRARDRAHGGRPVRHMSPPRFGFRIPEHLYCPRVKR
jgi:hypothetical protein